MTREEREDAIDIIQAVLDKYEEDECLATEITIGDEDIKAFKIAIKALEQEPILDKIRADINKLTVYYTTKDKGINLISQRAVNRVFDKYKAESEEK